MLNLEKTIEKPIRGDGLPTMDSFVLDFSVLISDAKVLFDKKNIRFFLGNAKRLPSNWR